MSFGAPEWFWALLVIPVLVALSARAEHRAAQRLRQFVSPRLLPQLAATIDQRRRAFRFALQLLALALAVVSLAQPRWGYTFQDVKRKGLDLLLAIDTSRSMLSNDVAPNRLERVKLATQDLVNQLEGDRVGLIAFAGRAFLQAPLTIDYEAAVESINDLDTKMIPDGGTNISQAISLATQTFGKSAMGNRALIIFTDGEELSGDALSAAKTAAEAGVHIFTIGIGTAQGSLIPIAAEGGGTAFVKDANGQVVKSKLDEKRLREIAQIGGGLYLHLENGPRTMQQLYTEGLSKLNAAEMDVRLSRWPIERFEWSLSLALLALTLSILIPERKRLRAPVYSRTPAKIATAAAAVLICCGVNALASVPALDAYRDGKFEDAYRQFQQTLTAHPNSRAEDKLQFDSGAAAYKLKDYGKALEAFSQALLSPDTRLQSMSHYNLGNTLYDRGETQPNEDKKLADWTNALQHYEQTLKLEPQNHEAKDNYEYVKNKIEELKKKKEPQPSSSPQSKQQNKPDKNQQQQSSSQDRQQQQHARNKPEAGQNQKPDDEQAQAKNETQKDKQQQPGETPSPSPGENEQQPQPSPGEQKQNQPGQARSPGEQQAEQSPTPSAGENESPSPPPGEGEGAEETPGPSASPTESPSQKMAGEIKGGPGEQADQPPDKTAALADIDSERRGEMSERQAEALLRSMKDEEARVRLDEHKRARRVYNDW
jgi:Ca-activated chloride channel homolog